MEQIPLSTLTLSSLNVRKTKRDADIAWLAADIEARGLKQNLVVVKTFDNLEEYEVVAGGRRFQALQMLAKRGAISPDQQIPCIVEEKDQGVETSLAENLHRVAMNPADEFEAFLTIIGQSTGDDDARIALCAKRFVVTEKHVRGRLRLAALAPVILEALRTDVIGLSAAMAYASVPDVELQQKVWAENIKPMTWKPHDPERVRDQMREKTYAASDPRVKFIGLANYRKAGGTSAADLFSTDSTERLSDTTLVDEMVKAKFEKEAPKLAKKLGVAGVVLAKDSWGNAKAPAGWEPSNGVTTYRDGEAFDEVADRIEKGMPTMLAVTIDTDGKLVRCANTKSFFRTKEEADEIEAARPVHQGYHAMTEEERAEQERLRHIRIEAVKLAVPKAKGTPFEDRIFLPQSLGWIREQISDDGQDVYIEFKLRLSAAEIEAQMEAAVPAYEVALAAKAERDAEVLAQRETKAAQAEARSAELMALVDKPPAVVEVEFDGTKMTLFRVVEDGRYLDTDIEGGEDEEYAQYGCDYFEAMIEEYEVTRWWATRDEWLAEQPAVDAPADTEVAEPVDA